MAILESSRKLVVILRRKMLVCCSSEYKDNREDQGNFLKECGVGDFGMFVGQGHKWQKRASKCEVHFQNG